MTRDVDVDAAPDRVLVGIDGSESSEEALAFALERFPEAAVRALFVTESLANYAVDGDVPNPKEQAERDAAEAFERAADLAAERDRELGTEALAGHPAKTIVEYADEEGFDHVVVGSTGKTGVERGLPGSVAETVVRRAHCPVTVVR